MKFLNINFEKGLASKLIYKHVWFCLFWLLGIGIFIFRIDSIIFEDLNIRGVETRYIAPVFFLFLLFFLIKNQKWYFTLAFVFYPFLLLFWFLPKWILVKGKVYLFLYYANFMLQIIVKFKRFLYILFVTILVITSLSISNSIWLKIFSLLYFSYIYYLFLKIFIRDFFKPSELLEPKKILSLQKLINDDNSSTSSFIKSLEYEKPDPNLDDIQKKDSIKMKLIRVNYFLQYLRQSLTGFRNERAYIKFCIFQLTLYLSITLLYFTFLNYQLFNINHINFSYSGIPTVFDFFYYTVKKITFSDIKALQPKSTIAKLFEILSFITMGIFFLIIVVSQFFSLKRDKIKEEVKLSILACESQSKLITKHLEINYEVDFQKIQNEQDGFVLWIKKIFERIF